MSNLQTAITQSVTKQSRSTGPSWRTHVGVTLCALGMAWAGQAGAAISAAERAALQSIYTSTNGASWTTSTNWNGAAGTECTWYGVTCDAGENNVINIDLHGNNLTGSLPSLNALTLLDQFIIDTNHIGSTLPNLSTMSNLTLFRAYSNNFVGSVPSLPTSMVQLNVSSNQLSGTIPSLAGLTNLEVFSVSSNNLSGMIPSLAGLTSLRLFVAGGNHFTGPLPPLAGLGNLQYFSVKENALTGPIPSLAGLDNLQSFYVGNNKLSGVVPAVPSPTNVLVNGGSQLCPNQLNATPNTAWDLATGSTPWYADCAYHAVPTQSTYGLAVLSGLLGLAGLVAVGVKRVV